MSAAAVTPDALDRLIEQAGERVNPIVVKEVRQGLRTRVFWVFFTLMLVACVFISLAFFATANVGASTGQYAFISFYVCLAMVQFFVIPYSAYRSMARETEEETWVLLTLTGLGPRKILLGKVGSFVLQGVLYSSAAAPFLLFSYYLNGIDLPTIIVAGVATVAYQVFLVAVAVSLATVAESRIIRSFMHFVVLGTLLIALGVGIGLATGLAESARTLFASGTFWLVSSAVVFGLVTTGILLFETAASRLSLATEDYAAGPRYAFVAQYVGMIGFFIWSARQASDASVLVAGALTTATYALLVGALVMTDRDGMAPAHWLTAGRWSLFKPGALRGYLLVICCLGLSTGLFTLLVMHEVAGLSEFLLVTTGPSFTVLYLSMANVLARMVPHPAYQTASMVRLVFLALIIFGCGLPPLLGELFARANDQVINALNPIVSLINIGKHGADSTPWAALVWAMSALCALWAFFVLRRADRGPII